MNLWNKKTEIDFFNQSRGFASPEQLFYKDDIGRRRGIYINLKLNN